MALIVPSGIRAGTSLSRSAKSNLRAPEIIKFAKKFGYAVLTIEDLVAYRQKHQC